MPKASIAFQVLPKVSEHQDVIRIVDKVIEFVKGSGVNYEVGSMETTMEGELDELFQIVREAQDICIKNGASSVFTNVKIMYSPRGVLSIDEKVKKHR